MFRSGMQTNLPYPCKSHYLSSLPGSCDTIFQMSPAKYLCGFPGKGPIVKIKSVLWITALVLGCFLTSGMMLQAEEDKLLRLCNEGNSVACFKRGKKYVTLDRDNKKAIPLFRKSCAADHMTACLWGGNLIQNTGKQYSPQWKEASKMFKKACEADEDGVVSTSVPFITKKAGPAKPRSCTKRPATWETNPAVTTSSGFRNNDRVLRN